MICAIPFVLLALLWANFAVYRFVHSKDATIKSKWILRLTWLFAFTIGIGSSFLERQVSIGARFRGFPVPIEAAIWEGRPGEETWVPYNTDYPLTITVGNALLLVLIGGLIVGFDYAMWSFINNCVCFSKRENKLTFGILSHFFYSPLRSSGHRKARHPSAVCQSDHCGVLENDGFGFREIRPTFRHLPWLCDVMTDYDAKVKIGCLVKAERLRVPSYVGGGGVTEWTEEYATTRMVLPLPGEGVDDSNMACPVCEQAFMIRRSSPARIYQYLQWALLGAAAVCFLMAAVGILVPLNGPDSFPRKLAYGFAAVGFLVLVAAMLSPLLPANLLRGDLVKIRNDDVRNHTQAPGFSGMRGHKILDVHISERHAAETF